MIGVFGGTFDPVHIGHLRVALEIQQVLGLEQVRFIPCAIPPHRAAAQATAAQRAAMLQAAITHQAGFMLDSREVDRAGVSYTVDTLQSLRQEFPQSRLCLMLGLDAFSAFDTWYRYQDVLALAHIVVMQRPGSSLGQLQAHPAVYNLYQQHRADEPQGLRQHRAGLIWLQTVTPLAVSSTLIRKLQAQGQDIRYLVVDPVRAYIHQHKLYC
ncbi:MAG: nicotinate-nucleotide adenylyltransferase [Gammaproteobacteria bacterium]|nr:nicotinate-nucleotide adenylyltransferase [Gammaproteobacteria bacterium]